jgi:hypothetical protein
MNSSKSSEQVPGCRISIRSAWATPRTAFAEQFVVSRLGNAVDQRLSGRQHVLLSAAWIGVAFSEQKIDC